MINIILALVFGFILGYFLNLSEQKRIWVKNICAASVVAFLFLIGFKVGLNKTIFQNLHKIFLYSFLLAIASILGSILLALFLEKIKVIKIK